MAELTLGFWVVTALVGAWLFRVVSQAGRPESTARATRLPPLLLFVHPLIGLGGIVVWVAYLSSGAPALTWVALGGLLLGAAVGDVLAVRTLRHRREDDARVATTTRRVRHDAGPTLSRAELIDRVADVATVEQHLPVPVIALHGATALVTIGLVLAEAISTL